MICPIVHLIITFTLASGADPEHNALTVAMQVLSVAKGNTHDHQPTQKRLKACDLQTELKPKTTTHNCNVRPGLSKHSGQFWKQWEGVLNCRSQTATQGSEHTTNGCTVPCK